MRQPGINDELVALRERVAQLEQEVAAHSRATAELLACADRYRAVADYTYDLEFWIDPQGKLVWVNLATERLTGYSVAECLAMSAFPEPLVDDRDLADVQRAFAGALTGTVGNDLPFRLRRKDGSSVWVAVSWQPMHAADGTCLGHRSSIRDISDRKLIEDVLLQERELLTSIVAHIPSGVFWKGPDFRYKGCNEAFARSAGVPQPEDIIGKSDYDLAWEPEQADYFRACDRRVMADDRPLLNIEEVERQADGRQAVLLTSKVPLHDQDGRVNGVLGIDTDISELKEVETRLRQIQADLENRVKARTAELALANEQLHAEIARRKRVEAVLRMSEERYRNICELTSDYAYALDVSESGQFRLEWITDAFERMTGYSAGDFEESGGWERIAHPDDIPVLERRRQCLLAGRSMVTEFRVVSKDGRTCWLRDHARPIWGQSPRRVVRVLGAAQDITERHQAEEEVQRHQAALAHVSRLSTMGELTGELAHELNQPLCAIVGNAQTAQRLISFPQPDLAELRDALREIATAGKHAGEVIRRLRDFLRRQHGPPAVLNLQRLIEEVADFIQADARQHHARIRFDIDDHLPAVQGDAIQLQQVILNLVRNGLESMDRIPEPQREMLIQSRRHGAGVIITVYDHGPGPGEDIAERIFQPFFTTKPTGLGLGLAISRSIVEAHGGCLGAESDREGGTGFSFTLPAIQEPPQ